MSQNFDLGPSDMKCGKLSANPKGFPFFDIT